MIIDISAITNNYKNKDDLEDYIPEYKEKSKIIMDNISLYNGYYMIVSINIFNILQQDIRFILLDIDRQKEASDIISGFTTSSIFKVGDINGFQCFVDIYQEQDEIILLYDKAMMRNSKIDYLLENDDSYKLVEEKRVKIIS